MIVILMRNLFSKRSESRSSSALLLLRSLSFHLDRPKPPFPSLSPAYSLANSETSSLDALLIACLGAKLRPSFRSGFFFSPLVFLSLSLLFSLSTSLLFSRVSRFLSFFFFSCCSCLSFSCSLSEPAAGRERIRRGGIGILPPSVVVLLLRPLLRGERERERERESSTSTSTSTSRSSPLNSLDRANNEAFSLILSLQSDAAVQLFTGGRQKKKEEGEESKKKNNRRLTLFRLNFFRQQLFFASKKKEKTLSQSPLFSFFLLRQREALDRIFHPPTADAKCVLTMRSSAWKRAAAVLAACAALLTLSIVAAAAAAQTSSSTKNVSENFRPFASPFAALRRSFLSLFWPHMIGGARALRLRCNPS